MRFTTRPIRNFLRSDSGFTLIELLITVAIIAIMAGMVLFAMFSAQETAKAQKTRALVAKLDKIIKAKWEAYKTRRVPVVIPPGETNTRTIARIRLDGLHDLMRMELPDRYTDIVVVQNPIAPYNVTTTPVDAIDPSMAAPAVFNSYLRRIVAAKTAVDKPSLEYQGAEMLYLIVTASLAGDEDSRGVFKADNIGDIDDDNMPEFVDGWGRPIQFIRWPAGFLSDLSIVARGTATKAVPVPEFAFPVKTVIVEFGKLNVSAGGYPNDGFSETPGAYVGGTLARLANRDAYPLASRHNLLDGQNLVARITGYDFYVDPTPTARFTCTVPLDTKQHPFGKGTPSGDFVVLAPDPFDPQGVYPMYPPGEEKWEDVDPAQPDWSLRTWAIFPLIYSAGSDGEYDIAYDIGLPYAEAGMSPFATSTWSPKQRMGTPNMSRFGWLDNIHNHELASR